MMTTTHGNNKTIIENMEPLHIKFLQYLQALKLSESECFSICYFAENSLPSFIQSFYDKEFVSPYIQTDHNYYRRLRNYIFTNDKANEENKACSEKYTQTISYYIRFLQSKTFKGKEKVYLTDAEKTGLKNAKVGVKNDPLLPPDSIETELTEGKIRQVNVTRHERNKVLRQICLKHYGYVCQVCGLNFEKVYGEIGKEFIEVHHLNPISNTNEVHTLDPINGLVPLCSNCHAMIHRGGKNGQPMSLKELQDIYNHHKLNKND